ncbi:hypothetical protein [Mailhella massiliensis]|uniref:hypothetical protein n=1 Tax=Mailhella massiliensis TaxID=1903261 RepID=UPI00097E0D99|nr:hypothetical protein [Mailhella massiliensis]
MGKQKIAELADGEYRLGRPYWAMPSDLILCRIFSSCEVVRRNLLKVDRQAKEQGLSPFAHAFIEFTVNKNVICSLDIAGLTGRRHDSVLRFMDRRKAKRPGFFVWPGRYVAPTGLRSRMYVMDIPAAFEALRAMKGEDSRAALAELQNALRTAAVYWPNPPRALGIREIEYRRFQWPKWVGDYLDSLESKVGC